MKIKLYFPLLLFFLSISLAKAQSVRPIDYFPMLEWDTSPYKSYRFTGTKNTAENWINFRLLFPSNYDSAATDGKKYPLIIVLHGTGESARMEWDNSSKTNKPYPDGDERIENNDHQLLYGGQQHLNAVKNGNYQGFVLFPQNFYGSWISGDGSAGTSMYRDLEIMLELVEYLVSKLKIDPNRIIIQGISNGAVGAWFAAYSRPEFFAALIPMSAHGDPAMASTLARIPIWVFQGQDDTNPQPEATEETVNAILNAGGNIKYTLYTGTGHNTWDRAYREPDYFSWIMAQNKDNQTLNKLPVVKAGENQTFLLPRDSTLLEGVATDEDGSIKSYHWQKLSGPAASIHSANAPATKITGLVEGEYVFSLSATDDKGATSSDDLTIIVKKEDSPPLSIQEEEEVEVDIHIAAFPNPFTRQILLNIEGSHARTYRISLLNSKGALLHKGMLEAIPGANNQYAIDMYGDAYKKGLYYVLVWTEGRKFKQVFLMVKE